jgi:hypothetical protein
LRALIIALLILFLLNRVIARHCRRSLPPPISPTDRPAIIQPLRFPPGFSFGTATATWQIEKNVEPSNWTLFEKKFRPDGRLCAPPHLNACDETEHFLSLRDLLGSPEPGRREIQL